MDYVWDFRSLTAYTPLFVNGIGITILYTVATVVAGLLVGLAAGIIRVAGPFWLTWPVRAYTEVFRCTPLLVQIVWIYYALPGLIGVNLSAGTACFLTLSLYAGSFYGEIFRGGIEAIDKGQWEAGKAIGMRWGKIFRRIILPQGVRVMIPSLVNQMILQLKNTSLVSTVAVGDLLYQATVVASATFRPLEAYTTVAVLYFAILYPLTLIAERVEKRLGVHK